MALTLLDFLRKGPTRGGSGARFRRVLFLRLDQVHRTFRHPFLVGGLRVDLGLLQSIPAENRDELMRSGAILLRRS